MTETRSNQNKRPNSDGNGVTELVMKKAKISSSNSSSGNDDDENSGKHVSVLNGKDQNIPLRTAQPLCCGRTRVLNFYNTEYTLFKVVRTDWPGISSINDIVIFGDSYSASDSSSEEFDDEISPSTWIDHFKTNLRKDRKLNVHNFAVPGDTAQDDLPRQMARFTARFPDRPQAQLGKPDHRSSLDPTTTLYVIWLGINDCGQTDEDDLEDILEVLFDAAHDLYVKAGARNLLFIDVPPIDRSPGARSSGADIAERYERWNELLLSNAEEFASSSKKATMLVFSSHRLLSGVLNSPGDFGFGEDDVTEAGGKIWEDQLHLTSDVHAILAQQLEGALLSITAVDRMESRGSTAIIQR